MYIKMFINKDTPYISTYYKKRRDNNPPYLNSFINEMNKILVHSLFMR